MSTEAELRAFVTKVANITGEARTITLLGLIEEAKALVDMPAATPAETEPPKEDTPHES